MSYARWGPDSDVYVFLSIRGHLECCGCTLPGAGGRSQTFASTVGMLVHLAAHERAGQRVPGHALEELREDQDENDAWMGLSAPARRLLDEIRDQGWGLAPEPPVIVELEASGMVKRRGLIVADPLETFELTERGARS
jgi:hypothetical protein